MSIVSGNIALSAVKMPESRTEDGNKEIIIRAYETEGTGTQAVIKFAENVKNAYFVDINENADNSRPVKVNGNELIFDVGPYKMVSVLVVF